MRAEFDVVFIRIIMRTYERRFFRANEYLDGKFNSIDERFNGIDERLSNLEENKADKSDVRDLMSSVDVYAKKANTYFQEMVALSHKVDRHEKWLRQVAEKLDIKLDY